VVKDNRPPPETDGDNKGEPDIVAGIGVLLREAREKKGESRLEVSRVLRIRRVYLEAIEDGRHQDLPGPAYATGFIRTYADHLGLDSDEIIRRFRTEAKGLGGNANLDFPVPVPETGIPGGLVLFSGLIIAAVAYGVWTLYSSDDKTVVDLISPPPDHLTAKISSDAAPAAKDDNSTLTTETGAQPATASDDAMTSSNEGSVNASAEPTLAPPPPQSEITATASSGDSSPQTDQGVAETGTIAMKPPVASDSAPAAAPSTMSGTVEVSGSGVESQSASTAVESEIRPPSSLPAEAEAPAPAGAITTDQRQETPVETTSPIVEREEPIIRGSGENAIQIAAIPPLPEMPVVEPRKAKIFGEESGESRILLRARVNSWVQIRDDVNNRLLVTRLLRVGDSVRVPDKPGLKLMTGNAGGLDILVDGEAVPPIGPLGAVRRDITLDADILRQGTAGQN